MEGGRTASGGRMDERLVGWASIGGYIGRDARTAQRYEVERGLPVRRMPGAGRSTVFALRPDLDAWMRGLETGASPVEDAARGAPLPDPQPDNVVTLFGPDADFDLTPVPPPEAAVQASAAKPRARPRMISAAIGACGGVALALGVLALANGPLAPAREGSAGEAAQAMLDQRGAAALTARSPAGLTRAIDDYTQAIVRDPKDVIAYAGLADSYNLAPEVTGMAPADAYARARAAAERALALDPRSVQALRAMAFVDFWWVQDRPRALGEFKRALALQPSSAQTLHWYANALAARGDPQSLVLIDRALAISPSSCMLVDKGWILLTLGHIGEARSLLEDVARAFPDNATAHGLLSTALSKSGDANGALREAGIAASLRHDSGEIKVNDLARRTLDTQGVAGMERAVADARMRLVADGVTSPFLAAAAASRVRERETTLDMLKRASLAHEPAMASLDINPDFAWLRDDASFRTLAAPRRGGGF